MKLVEIKNSLAKLYYQPADFALATSDFLTVDDGNQKILAQVLSIESTNKGDTNSAVLKLSMDLDVENNPSSYSGYVPSLDALISITNPKIISNIFSDSNKSLKLGRLTNSSNVCISFNDKLIDNFLYIQADKLSDIECLQNKLVNYCKDNDKKLVVIDNDGLFDNFNAKVLELGKNFKLPINNDILNYIYENDLTGLPVEQKSIVQDIILDIQEYIDSLEDKYIPFDTLLNVVNEIYQTDKSVGIILLRNKLIKYRQFNIFASNNEEFECFNSYVSDNFLTVLKLDNVKDNWQKEAVEFVLNNINTTVYFLFEADEKLFDKAFLTKIYKNDFTRPIVYSTYSNQFAPHLKYWAKNLILFKPNEQQKSFPTYNSFLSKLDDEEFIVSGEASLFTPLILKQADDYEEDFVEDDIVGEIFSEPVEEQNADISDDEFSEDFSQIELDDVFEDSLDVITEEQSDSVILEDDEIDLVEDEIAQDVDKMFFSDTSETEVIENSSADEPENELILEEDFNVELSNEDALSEDDLDLLDDFNVEVVNENEPFLVEDIDDYSESSNDDSLIDSFEEDINISQEIPVEISAHDQQSSDFSDLANLAELTGSDETDKQDSLTLTDDLSDFKLNQLDNIGEIKPLDEDAPKFSFTQDDIIPQQTYFDEHEQLHTSEIPVFKTELDSVSTSDGTSILEGNIVFHEKYGRGVVEELITYGNKTLCSIQFDNIGRRLLDPNIADLKQM